MDSIAIVFPHREYFTSRIYNPLIAICILLRYLITYNTQLQRVTTRSMLVAVDRRVCVGAQHSLI